MSETGIKSILVLDDDADFRSLLKTRLGNQFEGAEVEEYDPVTSGVPGEDFDWSRFDVLLLDYYLCLHGVTGLDILQANRKNPLFPATIMLTGAGNEEVAVRALKAGVYDYLRKEKMDKEQLRLAILDAFENRQSEKERLNELTNQSRAFNKALFYQQLEQEKKEKDGRERVLLLISLDNHEVIEERAGLIMRDNIVRHIAKQSYEIFQLGDCNPSITRLSDISVALLIDDPDSDKTLDFNLQGLCTHLNKRPYKYGDKKFRFTVSIGAIHLHNQPGSKAEAIIQTAREAAARAAKQTDNSYHIVTAPAREAPPQEPEQPQVTPSPSAEKPQPEKKPEAQSTQPAPAPSREAERPAPAPKPGAAPPPPAEKPQPEKKPEVQSTQPAPAPSREAERPAPEAKKPTPAPKPEPPPAAAKPAGKPAAEAKPKQNEDELVESGLGETGLKIKQALDEKRVTQTFQSIISLLSDEEDSDGSEIYYVSLQMLNKDGSILGPEEIFSAADSPAFRKYIDRWMLREAIGRIVNSEQEPLFVIRLSQASLADATLFNWLRTLLSGFEESRPGHAIAMEINAADFAALRKPAGALMAYLEKNHGFRFVLGDVGKDDDVVSLCSGGQFDFIRLDYQLLSELAETAAGDQEAGDTVISSLKAQGIQVIADNIEDAMTLTTIISTGVGYAMGPFIGEPAEQIDDQTNVESFEII